MKGNSHANDRWSRAKELILHEVRRFALMFLYLWALFLLLVLDEGIVLRQRGISFTAQGFALFNALVLAKVMLVAEDLDLGRWLRRRPLIYPILYESLLLTALFICVHVVEHIVIGWFKGEALAASVPHIGGGGPAGLACVAAILFVALIPFFAFKYVGRALGEGQLHAMLFETDVSFPADRYLATIIAVANDRAKSSNRLPPSVIFCCAVRLCLALRRHCPTRRRHFVKSSSVIPDLICANR